MVAIHFESNSPFASEQASSSSHESHNNGNAGITPFSIGSSAPTNDMPKLALSAVSDVHANTKNLSINSMSNKGHEFFELALKMRAFRQEILASNIANADTPAYKAVDIDIALSLRDMAGKWQVMPLTPTITDDRHFVRLLEATPLSFPVKYRIPAQVSIDGNTVEQDVEEAQFSDNAIRYQFTLDRVGAHYKHMLEMLMNLK